MVLLFTLKKAIPNIMFIDRMTSNFAGFASTLTLSQGDSDSSRKWNIKFNGDADDLNLGR